ncbi:MAG: hypothetical protein ACI93G_001430, partial [Hyphomonas sp.]
AIRQPSDAILLWAMQECNGYWWIAIQFGKPKNLCHRSYLVGFPDVSGWRLCGDVNGECFSLL